MSNSLKGKSETIELLRWPMALLVVCIHADFVKSGLHFRGVAIELSHSDFAYYLVTYVSQVLGRIAVPLFFIISGYLFFKNYAVEQSWQEKIQWYKGKVISRMKSLLLPLVSWNLLMCLMLVAKQYTPLHRIFPNANFDWSVLAVLSSPFCFVLDTSHLAPIDNPLWFVRNLFFISLLTPLLFSRRLSVLLLGICGLAWFWHPIDDFSVLLTAVFFIMGG